MTSPDDHFMDFSTPALVEGFAHVVAVEGTIAWLEPEQTTSCGSCASSSSCGVKGIGTVASRLEERRFPLLNHEHLRVGDRVVVGVRENALVKASLLAYALPLLTLLVAGGVAQGMAGSDVITMLAMTLGLAIGVVAARKIAQRLSRTGDLSPQFLRRAAAYETYETYHPDSARG